MPGLHLHLFFTALLLVNNARPAFSNSAGQVRFFRVLATGDWLKTAVQLAYYHGAISGRAIRLTIAEAFPASLAFRGCREVAIAKSIGTMQRVSSPSTAFPHDVVAFAVASDASSLMPIAARIRKKISLMIMLITTSE